MNLAGKNILIGITGGIAAYKICTLVSSLKKQGANVDVAMTKNATEFVSKLTFETLSGNPVTVDTFVRDRAFRLLKKLIYALLLRQQQILLESFAQA